MVDTVEVLQLQPRQELPLVLVQDSAIYPFYLELDRVEFPYTRISI